MPGPTFRHGVNHGMTPQEIAAQLHHDHPNIDPTTGLPGMTVAQIQAQLKANHPNIDLKTGLPKPEDVRAVQQFLVGHGYKLKVDGINGPLTKAAIANWTSGMKTRNPDSFNRQHGLAAGQPAATGGLSGNGPGGASRTSPTYGGGGGNASPTAAGGSTDIMGMLTSLLGRTATSKLISPNLAENAAAPYDAQAQTFQSELDQLPSAKAQALRNVSDWYGKVQADEKTAGKRDQALASSGASALSDAAKGIAASMGGAAMAGAGQIGAVGANDANTLSAMGANDAQLASDLGPIFDLARADANTRMSRQFDQGKLDLQNQLAQAQGQGDAAKMAALMQIVGANNNANQQTYANQSDLLKTLASLQISGANAATQAQSAQMLNALRASEIAKNAKKASVVGSGFAGATSAQKAKVAQDITNALLDTNSGKLKSGLDYPTALRDARNIVRTNGWNALDPNVIKTIIGPSLSMAGVQFANPNALYQP